LLESIFWTCWRGGLNVTAAAVEGFNKSEKTKEKREEGIIQ
jgi:hypothetical protein